MFSTRELSLLIWITVLVVISQFSRGIRESSLALLRAFFQASIIVILLHSLSYSAGIVYILHRITFWDVSMLKDSILWFISSAFLILVNITKAGKEKDFFKNIFIDNVKLILIFEFLVNFHTFSLLTEMILLPILIFLGLISAFAGLKDEHKTVKRMVERVFVIVGVILLTYSIIDIGSTAKTITAQIVKAFCLPLILTICFLPAAYLIALYMNYEVFFVRLGLFLKKKEDLKFAKRRLILKCNFSLRKLTKVSPLINELYDGSTREDIKRVIN